MLTHLVCHHTLTYQFHSLQDILRLLTLCFEYGMHDYTHDAFSRGFNLISIDTWLQVIPQLIARIHTPEPRVAKLLLDLLSQVR